MGGYQGYSSETQCFGALGAYTRTREAGLGVTCHGDETGRPACAARYGRSPLSVISLSMVSVPCGQQWSTNINWKIPEINNSLSFQLRTILSSVMAPHAIPLHPIMPVSHPFVQRMHTVHATHPSSLNSFSSHSDGHSIAVLGFKSPSQQPHSLSQYLSVTSLHLITWAPCHLTSSQEEAGRIRHKIRCSGRDRTFT